MAYLAGHPPIIAHIVRNNYLCDSLQPSPPMLSTLRTESPVDFNTCAHGARIAAASLLLPILLRIHETSSRNTRWSANEEMHLLIQLLLNDAPEHLQIIARPRLTPPNQDPGTIRNKFKVMRKSSADSLRMVDNAISADQDTYISLLHVLSSADGVADGISLLRRIAAGNLIELSQVTRRPAIVESFSKRCSPRTTCFVLRTRVRPHVQYPCTAGLNGKLVRGKCGVRRGRRRQLYSATGTKNARVALL